MNDGPRFIKFTRPDGEWVWINPEAVSTVALNTEGTSKINFAGAFQVVMGTPQDVVDLLERA